MEKRIKGYLAFLERLDTEHMDKEDLALIRSEMLRQIAFFQHERLIHLIVTVTFACLTVLSLFASLFSGELMCIILTCLFLVLLIPYIRHYYILENGVQKMYVYYDDVTSALNRKHNKKDLQILL